MVIDIHPPIPLASFGEFDENEKLVAKSS